MADYLNLAGRFHSTASDNVALESQEILDNALNKKQNVINTKVYNVEASIGYTTCDTAAATAAKTVTMDKYALPSNGGNIKVKFTYANTAASGVTLSINSTTAKPLYYSGQAVSNTNTWKAGETVDIYYDGTNYQANNVRGGVVELKDTLATPASASHEEGVTEYVVSSLKGTNTDTGTALTLYGLKAAIDEVATATASVGIGLRANVSGYTTNTVRFINTEAPVPLYGTINPTSVKAVMTLQQSANGTSSWTDLTPVTSQVNDSGTSFYRNLTNDNPITYYFRIKNAINGNTENIKYTGNLAISYVQPIYFGALVAYEDDDPTQGFIDRDITTLLNSLTKYDSNVGGGPTTTAKRSYSMNFDSHPRRIYLLVPKSQVTTINTNNVYWMSVISTNKIAFTRLTSVENSTYYVYASTVAPDLGSGSTTEARNIIFS